MTCYLVLVHSSNTYISEENREKIIQRYVIFSGKSVSCFINAIERIFFSIANSTSTVMEHTLCWVWDDSTDVFAMNVDLEIEVPHAKDFGSMNQQFVSLWVDLEMVLLLVWYLGKFSREVVFQLKLVRGR